MDFSPPKYWSEILPLYISEKLGRKTRKFWHNQSLLIFKIVVFTHKFRFLLTHSLQFVVLYRLHSWFLNVKVYLVETCLRFYVSYLVLICWTFVHFNQHKENRYQNTNRKCSIRSSNKIISLKSTLYIRNMSTMWSFSWIHVQIYITEK